MENKAISFDTGVVNYKLNDSVEIAFNPTDTALIERMYSVFSVLDRKQDEYRKKIESANDREVFEIARSQDVEYRRVLDEVFGNSFCDRLCPDVHICALAGGSPIWVNILFAIMDEIDAVSSHEQKLSVTRFRKYSEKYNKK